MDDVQYRAMQELKAIRRECRMSMDEFAKLLNVSWHTVKAWEGGQRNIIAPTLLGICWGPSINAALIANKIFQAAFDES